MQETKRSSDKIGRADRLDLTVNENCKLDIPQDILEKLLKPHKLTYYCFVFLDQGTETYKIDLQDITISDGQMIFGLPNQIFCNPPNGPHNLNYKAAFDDNLLALLPNSFPFLLNPLNSNTITFTPDAKERVKSVFAHLYQLLHHTEAPRDTEIILAYMNTLLTEFNSAYFEQGVQGNLPNSKLSKYIAFKLAVETHLTEQNDVQTIADKLAMTTSSLYSVVKEFSGVSPKEWMTNRLILEAQRKLQYSTLSVKELAYELGFNDPDYFSRLFKKTTGKSVSEFLANHNDLSSN
ncbi:helix-turn-helix domain-containing protein [Mucilaginibacter paludis]|uniref:Transcriptional regulator, AraC family n=1 Tax=Mucilaginibacter paludis DSM 18603 TaxID=714943 RepID=H1Y676_9SPHI|nr:helix-turn-helix domain-containing protein [Mucilaginibacter paludis]EHQ24824.1 transcriptional regulator, AraC family [Mucilaginibacter paludis DSM 18603]